MVDFTRYVPPGVYVEDETSSIVTTIGVEPTVVCIVGDAVGHYKHTESKTFVGDSVVLSKMGADQTTIRATRTTYDIRGIPTTTEFVMGPGDGSAGDFYVSSYDASGGPGSAVVTLTRRQQAGGLGIQLNDVVTFTYQYADTTYHQVKEFDDYDSFVGAYGPALDLTTGAVLSPLTLACKVAFENGANRVVAVALDPADGGDVVQRVSYALAKTTSNLDVNVIVPLIPIAPPTGTTEAERNQAYDDAIQSTITMVQQHCNAASEQGARRVAIVGFDQRYNASAERVAQRARDTDDQRITLAYPNAMNYFNGAANQTMVVDGFYLAAAYAGRLSSQRIQDPLTRKAIRGFAGIAAQVPQANLTRSSKDAMSSAGVAVTEVDRANRLVVRHGTTTDRSALTTRELSVVRARDALFNLMFDGVDSSGLIGTPIDTETPIRVKGVVAGLLEGAVTSGIIIGYSDLKVRQQGLPSGDPTVIDVRFSYKPALPLNYITVSFSLNVQTGESDLAAAV